MKKLAALLKIVIPTFLIVGFASFYLFTSTQAASLTAVYIYMSRIQGGLTTGVEYVLAFAPAQTIPTGGTVKIEFPDGGDTLWCRNAGALTVAASTASQADLATTNWDIDAGLPGTLTATCAQGAGAGSVDTITISGVTELTAGTTYGVSIAGNTGLLGTGPAGQQELNVTVSSGTAIDSKTFKVSIIANDSVVITATVSEAPNVNCTISSNAINLGTLYPGGSYAIGSHTIGTSATTGYYWAAYGTGDGSTDAGLYKSTATTHLIPSGATATLNLASPSIYGFGLTVSDPDAGDAATVATNFVDTTAGTFGTIDRLYSGAKLILSQNGVQSTSENATVTYGAKASAAAPAGTYQETVTFICGGYY